MTVGNPKIVATQPPPRMVTEYPQNIHRISTEYPQNIPRTPTEWQQHSHRTPLEQQLNHQQNTQKNNRGRPPSLPSPLFHLSRCLSGLAYAT